MRVGLAVALVGGVVVGGVVGVVVGGGVGGSGTPVGVTVSGWEAADVPAALVAVTVKDHVTSFARLGSVTLVDGAETEVARGSNPRDRATTV